MQPSPPLRRFVFLGGYYPHTQEESFRRFQRGLAHFSAAWSIRADADGLTPGEGAAQWQARAAGPNWQQETAVHLFRWDDLITEDRSRGWLTRLPLGLAAFVDVIISGTLWRYIRVSWRYALFFLYPYLLLTTLCVSAWLIAGLAPPWPGARPLLALGLGAGLIALFGRRLLIDHLIDDWIYAIRLIRKGDSAAEARLDTLARTLVAARHDELVIFGHSLGAVHGACLIDRMLTLAPDGPPIRFATAGSSVLKVALHPAARTIRAVLGRIAASPRVIWVDFQAHNDAMNFYKADPVATLKLAGRPALIRPVRFSALLSKARYRRIRRNFFRLHSQFISANDKRGRYDYYMICCGPFALDALAGDQNGAMDWIDATGGLTDRGQAAAGRENAA